MVGGLILYLVLAVTGGGGTMLVWYGMVWYMHKCSTVGEEKSVSVARGGRSL